MVLVDQRDRIVKRNRKFFVHNLVFLPFPICIFFRPGKQRETSRLGSRRLVSRKIGAIPPQAARRLASRLVPSTSRGKRLIDDETEPETADQRNPTCLDSFPVSRSN